MSNKKRKAPQRNATAAPDAVAAPVTPPQWGYEEMLTELEAIVSDAEQRLEQEEQ